jgi:hypothetical protein
MSQRTGPVTLAYACRFPAGTYQVGARVTASYPATAVAGRPLHPAALTLAVTVPAAALASLGPRGTAIAVAARLATSGARRATGTSASAANTSAATSGAATTSAAPAAWASLAAPPAPLPEAGQDLGSGPLQPVAPLPSLRATRAGTMTVTVGSLTLLFTPGGAGPTATSSPAAAGATSSTAAARPSATAAPSAGGTPSPSPAQAAAVAAACTLKPGQDAALATIAVRNAPANRAAKQRPYCPPLPKGGLKLNPRFPLPPPPRGATVTHPGAEYGCAYIVGYSDVRKLNGASLLGPGLINLAVGDRLVYKLSGSGYYQEDSAGELDYQACRTCRIVHALPPARTTFLSFGFMPVSATMQLTEIGTINLIGVGTGLALTSNVSWSLMELRIYDVEVNGHPLAVGPHCQTVRPLLVKLTGLSSGAQPYSLQAGGPLTGQVTIPPFTGCGVTENLDPLFTGTVSGPGNYTKLTQGPLCTLIGNLGCPPQIPSPLR